MCVCVCVCLCGGSGRVLGMEKNVPGERNYMAKVLDVK